jgi:hypothetical protein
MDYGLHLHFTSVISCNFVFCLQSIHLSSGTMEGGEGIIGLPDDGSVQKYDLGTSTRVQLMSDDKQTLMYTSVTQEGGQTIMEFAKYLSEPGEYQ